MRLPALITLLFITSCSGITPDGEIRNNREEGPETGLFTGHTGEYVIEIKKPGEASKRSDDKEE